jgi:hypothetical protein
MDLEKREGTSVLAAPRAREGERVSGRITLHANEALVIDVG